MELLEFVRELDIQYYLEVKRNMILFMTGVTDINSRDFLLDKKNMKIFSYDILYKHFMGSIPLRIRFDEINGVMKIYDGVRC